MHPPAPFDPLPPLQPPSLPKIDIQQGEEVQYTLRRLTLQSDLLSLFGRAFAPLTTFALTSEQSPSLHSNHLRSKQAKNNVKNYKIKLDLKKSEKKENEEKNQAQSGVIAQK